MLLRRLRLRARSIIWTLHGACLSTCTHRKYHLVVCLHAKASSVPASPMPTRPYDAATVVSEAAPDEDTVDALALLAASSLAVLSSALLISSTAAVGLVPSSSGDRVGRYVGGAAWAGARSRPCSRSTPARSRRTRNTVVARGARIGAVRERVGAALDARLVVHEIAADDVPDRPAGVAAPPALGAHPLRGERRKRAAALLVSFPARSFVAAREDGRSEQEQEQQQEQHQDGGSWCRGGDWGAGVCWSTEW
jgi:hypothetical protein